MGGSAEEAEREVLDASGRVPPGFRRLHQEGVIAHVREDLLPMLVGAGLLERDGLLAERTRGDSYQGRGTTAIVRLANQRFVVRRFLPGGLLRFLRPATFATPERPFREVELYLHLRSRGIPTLDPVAAIARRSGWRWILHLVTLELESSSELLALLAPGGAPPALQRRVLAAAGRSVRELHDAGVRHADLHLKNLLYRDGAVYVIDLDRSRLDQTLPRSARLANLERLWRYARRRLEPLCGERSLLRSAARFLRQYEPERSARRILAREIERTERRHRWRHRLGRWLEAPFTRSR